jgi:hypothetical protein
MLMIIVYLVEDSRCHMQSYQHAIDQSHRIEHSIFVVKLEVKCCGD